MKSVGFPPLPPPMVPLETIQTRNNCGFIEDVIDKQQEKQQSYVQRKRKKAEKHGYRTKTKSVFKQQNSKKGNKSMAIFLTTFDEKKKKYNLFKDNQIHKANSLEVHSFALLKRGMVTRSFKQQHKAEIQELEFDLRPNMKTLPSFYYKN